MVCASVMVCFVCLKVGLQHVPMKQFIALLCDRISGATPDQENALYSTIILQVRLPRIVLAFFVGMALSVAGAVFQSLLRNPLAEPHLIGVSSGAALGSVIATVCFSSFGFAQVIGIPLASFCGALCALALIYCISMRKGALSVYTLLLVGVILNSFFVSVIIFMQSIVSADQLASIFSWLLGSLAFVDTKMIGIVVCVVIAGTILLFTQSAYLNILSLGEQRAQSLGVNVEVTKIISYIGGAIITGVVVSVSGLIGFVGLVVPHIARMLFGPDHRIVIPSSACIGGMLLVIADTVARTIIAPQEIPVGVVTSFLGAPFFIILLKRKESRTIF